MYTNNNTHTTKNRTRFVIQSIRIAYFFSHHPRVQFSARLNEYFPHSGAPFYTLDSPHQT